MGGVTGSIKWIADGTKGRGEGGRRERNADHIYCTASPSSTNSRRKLEVASSSIRVW